MKSNNQFILTFAALAVFTHTAAAARGDLDLSFNPSVNGRVYVSVLQADGKILIAGAFSEVGGMARSKLARLHADGTLDQDFNPNVGTSDSHHVSSVAVQPDGKIIIGGRFANIGEVARTNVARLNADGTVDLSFNPAVGGSQYVGGMVVQADGKVLIGGQFTSVNGVDRNSLARLNTDGTLDMDFHPLAEANSEEVQVYGMAMQPDGKILVFGRAFKMGGTRSDDVVRLNSDGTRDMGFNVNVGADVESWALQADAKILIGGDFSTVGGVLRLGLARLNADGTLDLGFDPVQDYELTDTIAVLTGGKILIGSDVLGGGLAQLHTNGALEPDFNPDVNDTVTDIAIQADGKILIAGYFTAVNGVPRTNFARLLGAERVSLSARPSGNEMILSWPTNVTGFSLQATTNLSLPVLWVGVTNVSVVNGAYFTVTNACSGGAQYYRLVKP